jgi:hypothetical protein
MPRRGVVRRGYWFSWPRLHKVEFTPHRGKVNWLFVTFGELFQNILMFQGVMRLEHFLVTSPKNPFRSIVSVKHHHQK